MCSHERDEPSDVQSLRGEVLPVLRKLLSVVCVCECVHGVCMVSVVNLQGPCKSAYEDKTQKMCTIPLPSKGTSPDDNFTVWKTLPFPLICPPSWPCPERRDRAASLKSACTGGGIYSVLITVLYCTKTGNYYIGHNILLPKPRDFLLL